MEPELTHSGAKATPVSCKQPLIQILVRSVRATRQSKGQHYVRNVLVLKSCYRASFFPRTVLEWNHLPPYIRDASSLDCCKCSLMRD